jgi:hypothetical protein
MILFRTDTYSSCGRRRTTLQDTVIYSIRRRNVFKVFRILAVFLYLNNVEEGAFRLSGLGSSESKLRGALFLA